MVRQLFIVSVTCSYLTEICFYSHQALDPLPQIPPLTLPDGRKVEMTEMSNCEEMIRLAKRIPHDQDMRVLKEYCMYENPGPSYTLIRHPNGRVQIAPW
jgi:hypothetical protein